MKFSVATNFQPDLLDALDGFLAGMKNIHCRETDCSVCGYCSNWTEKAVRVDENFRAEMRNLYRKLFGERYSGEMWGVEAKNIEILLPLREWVSSCISMLFVVLVVTAV